MNRSAARIDDDENASVRHTLLPFCRLQPGQVWRDPAAGHVVGCGDACDAAFVETLTQDNPRAALAVHDPPYNVAMFRRRSTDDYIEFCRRWINCTSKVLQDDASMYVWMGADQKNHFQPLPQFMAMMAHTEFQSKSFITMRNQRGYGTRRNWMAVRQELLYYIRGKPDFVVQYTDIPKILRGYYKEVKGALTENMERSNADTIRASNVWVDIQQVFYRREENVEICPAQKPLKAIERILRASSAENETVIDFFAHAGTTLLAAERTGRKCITCDIDPICAEISIRRLERYRRIGKTGWQRGDPFEVELSGTVVSRQDKVTGSF